MALPILRVGAEISFKGACGKTVEATGSQSNEDMSKITKIMSEVSTAPPSPTMSFVRCISSERESVIDSEYGSAILETAYCSDSEEGEHAVEKEGIMWTVIRGAPPSIEKLESSLMDVKALIKAKFGKDVDAEASDNSEGEHAVEKEGIMWTVTRGAPPSIEKLESSLMDVKALYTGSLARMSMR